MADGDATELALSRTTQEGGVGSSTQTRVFRVENTKPEDAVAAARIVGLLDPLPMIGSRHPDAKYEAAGVRLVRYNSDYFPGSIRDSIVTLVYASSVGYSRVIGHEGGTKSIKRVVIWETETTLISETVHFDLDGRPIPGGVQRDVPLRTDRAVLDGVAGGGGSILSVAKDLLGKVNKDWVPQVQGWTAGATRFTGIRIIPKTGTGGTGYHDEGDWSRVELTFQVKPTDWKHRTIKLGPTGLPIMQDGRAQVIEYTLYEEAEFNRLFPSNWQV